MAFCKNCGAELNDEQKFCGNCGAPVDEKVGNTANDERGSYETPEYEPINEQIFEQKQGKLSVGMLVWSIINTVFSVCICCAPIGVIPLIFAIMTSTGDYEASEKNRKRALVANIIVTVVLVISLIASIMINILYAEALEQFLIEYSKSIGA